MFKIILNVLLFLSLTVSCAAANILYIPLDNRPVCLEDPVTTLKAAGADILTPPENLLAGRGRDGDPEQLWAWLRENAQAADAMVVSADSLLYGGLVASRLHAMHPELLETRLNRFRELRENNPRLRLYVFSTVMRTPKMSAGGVDPVYFERYGQQLFDYAALRDKSEQQPLTSAEKRKMARLFAAIPEKDLIDWLSRRQKNYEVNNRLLSLTREGLFSYFILGLDDNAPYSRTRQELRHLLQTEERLSPAVFSTFAGADQLGIILLARAVNDLSGNRPFVAAVYAAGTGPDTVPSYQGEPIADSIFNHIIAAGGYLTRAPERAELVLAVNTPKNGVTLEASNPANTPAKRRETAEFAAKVAKLSQEKPVAVADIAFGNGADNSLMAELVRLEVPARLAAYSGWNTASNSIGFAIAQGMLANRMNLEDRHSLLSVRLLDDWAYQANVRQEVLREIVWPQQINAVYLDSAKPMIEAQTTARLQKFAAERFGGFAVPDFTAKHPWNRMFEVQIVLRP